ncbi:TPA: hypothetical protein HA338_03075 [Methanosarcina acetivorans]|uniref:Uncharacterized protein n=1 Tax=Methanosarcina acetivorans TaxID=2214 RepID=A0A832VXM3_9EURY|nr:hypothetical protein [Methanosarcina acetivorans]HIH93047.1 hypothetical protein [Methanosarcina acetivorans]
MYKTPETFIPYNVNIFYVYKTKLAILSFIASELFILTIELTFGVPLNVYYYLDPTRTNAADAMIPLWPATEGWAESTGNLETVVNFLSMFLRFMSSPALLIAGVVYLLAPDDESRTEPD